MQPQLKASTTSLKEAQVGVTLDSRMVVESHNPCLEDSFVRSTAATDLEGYNINNTHMGGTRFVTSVTMSILPNRSLSQHDSMRRSSRSTRIHRASEKYISITSKTHQTIRGQLSQRIRSPTASMHTSPELIPHSSSQTLAVSWENNLHPPTPYCSNSTEHAQLQPYSLLRFLKSGIDDPWNSQNPTIINARVVERELDEVDELFSGILDHEGDGRGIPQV